MGLELIREADMHLDFCGRPTPPPGYKFVDLPRAFGYTIGPVSVCVGVPFTAPSERVQNKATTLFMCEGISIQPGSTPRFNVRFPSGRYYMKLPSGSDGSGGGFNWFPTGYGSMMYKFTEPEPIPADARITVDTFGGFSLYIVFWGKLRYLVSDSNSKSNPGAVSCIVGYPTAAQARNRGADLPTMPNPIPRLAAIPRYPCDTPNGNILAPETFLGNQCTPESPEGKRHNSYRLFSDPITVLQGRTSNNNAVIIPGNDDMIFRRVRVHTVKEGGDTPAVNLPCFSLRHPSGYSVTGGDQIPVAFNQQWFYLFPSIRCRPGDRLILDVSNVGPGTSGVGSITNTFEFDGVKEVADR